MPPRLSVPERKRFFVGAEGESERSFATWLRRLCDEASLYVHLDVFVCGGGDGFEVANYAAKQYRRRTREHGQFASGLILLDSDRVEQDRPHGRNPEVALKNERGICVIYLRPNLEGLLLRLHKNHEQEFVPARVAQQSLRRLWRDYEKPAPADALSERFSLGDLQRASRHDTDLHKILATLGLSRDS